MNCPDSGLPPTMDSPVWTVDGTTARLNHGSVQGSIDLRKCGAGLCDLSLDGSPRPDTALFELRIPRMNSGDSGPPPVDIYSRQNDLVAIYEQTSEDRLRLQTCWRAIETSESLPQATLLELVVSVQTDLLDSDPETHAASKFSDCDVTRFVKSNDDFQSIETNANGNDASFALMRPRDSQLTIFEAAHPSDSMGIASTTDGNVQEVRHPIFSRRLEKGVIRRARLRFAILPRAEDLQLATACYREFAMSEPMLTA